MALTKSQANRIRSLIARVHERRLAESLAPVEEALGGWRAGEATAFEVDEQIRQHTMRSRRFYLLYANAAVDSPETGFILDEALQLGLISPHEHRQLRAIWSRPRPG